MESSPGFRSRNKQLSAEMEAKHVPKSENFRPNNCMGSASGCAEV